jgi:hypothetical protein
MKPDTDLFQGLNDDSKMTEWRGMPEFNQPDNSAYRQITVSFDDEDGIKKFAELVEQNITAKTKSIWFPPRKKNNVVDLFWFDKSEDK